MGRSLRQTITSRTHSDLPLVVWGRRAPGVARQRREGSSAWKAATSSGYTGFSGLAARSGMCRPWSAKGSGGRGRGTRSAGQLVHCRCRLVPPLLVAGQRLGQRQAACQAGVDCLGQELRVAECIANAQRGDA